MPLHWSITSVASCVHRANWSTAAMHAFEMPFVDASLRSTYMHIDILSAHANINAKWKDWWCALGKQQLQLLLLLLLQVLPAPPTSNQAAQHKRPISSCFRWSGCFLVLCWLSGGNWKSSTKSNIQRCSLMTQAEAISEYLCTYSESTRTRSYGTCNPSFLVQIPSFSAWNPSFSAWNPSFLL